MARRDPKPPRHDACAHCGASIGPAAERPFVEKPFAECASCGGFVTRSLANEWDLFSPRAKLDFLLRAAVRAMTGGLAGLAAFLLGRLAFGRGPWWLAALVGFGFGALAAGAWEARRLSAVIRRSRRRMGDPMYLARLAEYEWRELRGRGAAGPGRDDAPVGRPAGS